MSQAIRALLPSPPDFSSDAERRRRLDAANDDLARLHPSGRDRARFSVVDNVADPTGDPPKAKEFRFRIDPDVAGQADGSVRLFEKPATGNAGSRSDAARSARGEDLFDGLSIGDPSRNAPSFLASLITQSRLGQGLAYSAHGAASQAYRQAGARPPMPESQPRFVSITV